MSDPRRADPRRGSNYADSGGYRQPQRPVKDETGPQIHDEADLVSFRNDALKRMLMNQEQLENVTTKYVHTSKIIPPGIWATSNKESASMDDAEMEKYLRELLDKPYFGDLRLMKKKEEMLQQEIESLRETHVRGMDDLEYTFQQAATNILAEKFAKITDKESFEQYQKETEQILEDMKSKHSKEYKVHVPYTKRSVSPLSFGIKVERAPESYNPKLVNSLIGLGNDKVEPDYMDGGGFETNDTHKQNSGSAEPQDQFAIDILQGEGHGPTENNASGVNNTGTMMDDNIDSMFGGDNAQSMLDDDMNDLINFDQADDDDAMGSNGFDGEFLKLE